MRVSERSLRLSGVVKEVLPRLMMPHLDPSVHGIITVERVEVSGDLLVAKVYVCQVGSDQPYLGTLRKVRKIITHGMCNEIKTRRPIELRFVPLAPIEL